MVRDKIRFNPDTRNLVPPSQLEKANFKGDYDFEYTHEKYYPFISDMTKKRRDDQFRRWQEHGNGACGASEFILKGGMEEARAREASTLNNEKTSTDGGTAGTAVGGAGVAVIGAGAIAGDSNPKREAESSHIPSRSPSTHSAGYVLPKEAENAPDYVGEPSPYDSPTDEKSTLGSGNNQNGSVGGVDSAMATGASDQPMQQNSASFDAAGQAPQESSGQAYAAPSGGTNAAFSGDAYSQPSKESYAAPTAKANTVSSGQAYPETSQEPYAAYSEELYAAQSDGVVHQGNPNLNGGIAHEMQSLETGVRGLVVNPDGSIGAAQ